MGMSISTMIIVISKFKDWTEKEASSLDQIKMTKNWLEFDRKIFTMTIVMF